MGRKNFPNAREALEIAETELMKNNVDRRTAKRILGNLFYSIARVNNRCAIRNPKQILDLYMKGKIADEKNN